MSSKYPLLKTKDVVRVLNKLGFIKVAQKGSHCKYKNLQTKQICIVPMHYETARGTLESILEQADIKLETFLNQL